MASVIREVDTLKCHNFTIKEWYNDIYDRFGITVSYINSKGCKYYDNFISIDSTVHFIKSVADTQAIADEVIEKVKERWS